MSIFQLLDIPDSKEFWQENAPRHLRFRCDHPDHLMVPINEKSKGRKCAIERLLYTRTYNFTDFQRVTSNFFFVVKNRKQTYPLSLFPSWYIRRSSRRRIEACWSVEKDTSIWISILRDTLWPRHEISRCNFWRCWRFQEDHFSWRSMEPHQILNLCLVFETAWVPTANKILRMCLFANWQILFWVTGWFWRFIVIKCCWIFIKQTNVSFYFYLTKFIRLHRCGLCTHCNIEQDHPLQNNKLTCHIEHKGVFGLHRTKTTESGSHCSTFLGDDNEFAWLSSQMILITKERIITWIQEIRV